MEIVPLTQDRLADWLAFFDGPAFADNPEWGTCYCRCFLFGPDEDGRGGWDGACCRVGENRAAMAAGIAAGEVDGSLAYRDGRVVGWAHHGPSARFHPPRFGPLLPDDADTASIVCFLVAPEHRGTGVARALLAGALAELGRRGFRHVDARPLAGDDPDAKHQFCGPRALYEAAGFVPVGEPGRRQRYRLTLPA